MAQDPEDPGTTDLFGAPQSPRKPFSRTVRRLVEASGSIATDPAEPGTFHHSVLCQTSMPYRDPGPDVRRWDRKQGNAVLEIDAGRALDPRKGEFVDLALPSGAKARLILIYLNSEAVRNGSPVVEVGDSMTAFVRRLQQRDPTGPEIKKFKDQLAFLSAATIRLGMFSGDRAIQINTQIVTKFDLWFPKNGNQRVLWPSTVQLSADYFDSLASHAVPLDERAVGALAHSAMALDLYAWFAQRLHRIPEGKPQFIPWTALQEQFGQGFGRLDNFRRKFREALTQALAAYPAATVEDVIDPRGNPEGLRLWNSPPPVLKRLVLVDKPREG